jgi:hypothetical protein
VRSNWKDCEVPGWSEWQALIACVFPFLDMQDEIDHLELGDVAWIYLASEAR